MERTWGMLRAATRAADAPRSVAPGTVGRIWAFAAPYRRMLLGFLLLTVVGAGIGVATPVLAGRVVNAIVAGGQASAAAATVLGLAGGSRRWRSWRRSSGWARGGSPHASARG